METGGDSKLNATLGVVEPATNGYQQEQGQGSSTNDNIVLPSSSLSQNPFLVTSDTTNNEQTHHSSTDDMLVGGNLFHEQTTTDNKLPVEAFDSWQNQPSNVESHNPFQVTEQRSSDVDSFMPKHDHYDDATTGQHSTSISPAGFILEHGTNKGSEIQNPPVQVMERPKESTTSSSSQYVFPSHVFARNTTNAPVEWSTASNESLFSIYMGNMSFSSEQLACSKSCEMDKPGEVNVHDQPNITSPNNNNNNQQPQAPVNKFNDISQRTAELHEESYKVTEAQAAETMREVIMENFQTEENVGKKEEKKSNSSRHQSDGSTKSYAFQTSADGDKSVSSRGGARERQKPQKEIEQKEAAPTTTNAVDQAPKSNTPPTKWLNCFSCCTICR